jgi:hypothetical protein
MHEFWLWCGFKSLKILVKILKNNCENLCKRFEFKRSLKKRFEKKRKEKNKTKPSPPPSFPGLAPSSGPTQPPPAHSHLPFLSPLTDWPGPLVSFPFLLSPSVSLPCSASRAPPPAVSAPSSPSCLQFPSSRCTGAPAASFPSFNFSSHYSPHPNSNRNRHGHQWPVLDHRLGRRFPLPTPL